MHGQAPKRWFVAIPLLYSDDPAFWLRDCGPLCLSFRQLGVDSRLVVIGDPSQRHERPAITCTLNQMQDPAWWQQWGLRGVVLNSWAAPRYEPIARAIKESQIKLVIRLDSDGLKSPRVHFRRFLSTNYHSSRDEKRKFPFLYAFLKAVVFRYYPPAFDRKTCMHLEHADAVLIESPLAKQYLRRYLLSLNRPDLALKLQVVPHSALAQILYDPSVPKRRKIIAVGRWDSAQKDAPTLMQVLARVLPEQPEYSVDLAGSGTRRLEKLRALLPDEVQSRIAISGFVEHSELQRRYQQSQILLFTSRYEGFPVSAAEALCCGCSIVGAALVPSLNYISSVGAGTLAVTRSIQDYADALEVEIDAWQRGERDPQHISQDWQKRVSVQAVASKILSLFSER